MPKKILIFSVVYYPKFIGGAEVAVKEITDRLKPDEYEFHLICLRLDKNLPREEKIGNVHVYRVGFAGKMKESADSLKFPLHYNKYLYPFISAWKALKLSKTQNFDLSWAIMANYSGFGALFFKILKQKIPFLLTLQEGDPTDYIKRRVNIFYPLFKMIFRKADLMQTISNYLAEWGKEMGFRGKPVVVPNGVDIKNFQFSIFNFQKRQEIRKGLGLKESDIALVTTSRLVIKNGVGDVIKALPDLPDNVKFVVFGEGYMEKELKKLASSLGVSEKVIWKGHVSHNEMPKYLKSCDIFIRPSLSEGFGNSFIEAMAAGLPVIGTPVGGIVDFLRDGETGYFCQPQNPQSIAQTVKRITSDPNKNKIIENAHKMVSEKYDWNLVARQMKDVFGKTTSYIRRSYSDLIAVNNNGEFLLQHRSDDAPKDPGKWGLFGGGAEKNEDPKQALLRELKEELDLDVSNAEFYKQTVSFEEGIEKERNYFFIRVEYSADFLRKKQKEGKDLGFFTFSQIKRLELRSFHLDTLEKFFTDSNPLK